MKIKWISLILATCTFGATMSQSLNTLKLDSLFNTLSIHDKAMGSLAISKDGKTLYTTTIGSALINASEQVPATNETKYRIGSITKMFTATLILLLREENKLHLETTLSDYFPEIPNSEKITIEHLLNHRSGIHSFTDDPTYMEWMSEPKTQQELIQLIAGYEPDFQPDERYAYSNSNYVLLGYIIEKTCEQPYHTVLDEKIVSKIGLTGTYYGKKTTLDDGECFSYYFENGSWQQLPETDMSIPHGAGAIVSTPHDLTRFAEALFSAQLINRNSLAKMTIIRNGYGLGMVHLPFQDIDGYGHDGAIDGFGSILVYFPDKHLSVAYCTNGQNYPMNEILTGILNTLFDEPYSIPVFKTINLSIEELKPYPGTYISDELSLSIMIKMDQQTLTAQAEGQESFALTPSEKNVFHFDPAGIVIEFNETNDAFVLHQGGGEFVFVKTK